MRLLFLCLLTGEIGLAFFGYYGHSMYHDGSRAWVGICYAILPLLLIMTEVENNITFQRMVQDRFRENQIIVSDIIYSGSTCAMAYSPDVGLLYFATPDETDQAVVMLSPTPVRSIRNVVFVETLDGWKMQIDEISYPVKAESLFAAKVGQWEGFFTRNGVPVSITYDDNFHYWFRRTLGVTFFIPGILAMLISFL